MATRVIPEETIAQVRALHHAGTSKKKIALRFGLSRDTVRRYVDGELPKHANADAVASRDDAVTAKISERFDEFLLKATDTMRSDEFVELMAKRPKDLALGVAIVTDKRELLAGRATSRGMVSVRVSLVAPGALKGLTPGVIEGDYRTVTEGEAPAEDAPVRS